MIKNIISLKNRLLSLPITCYVVKNVTYVQSCERTFHFYRDFSSSVARTKIPITMKIDSPELQSIFTPELKQLVELFEKHGYELRIVGGAVRDLLSGKKPHDLDFATTATPQQMKEMFETEQVRILNNRGEKHGTITPRINEKENFEVTTLRTDVETDGRHAEVEFTTDWALDAERRDLTINSMYLGFDGTVYDYFHGFEDLKKKRVVFVGNASKRIQEDYLRILRYFRFYGRIAENANSHDEDTLKAIEQNASGLDKISGERIWSELQRILVGNYAFEITKKMLDLGLSSYIGLGTVEDLDMKSFENVYRLRQKYPYKAITHIAALLPNEDRVFEFHSRVKLSGHERDLALFIVLHKHVTFNDPPENPLRPFQRLLVTTKLKQNQVLEHILELFRFHDREDLLTTFHSWKIPYFPVNGNMIKEKGILNGSEIGFIMNQMKESWISSDFKLSQNDLLEKIPEFQAELDQRKKKKLKVSS